MRALIVGWFSYKDMGASAGDLIAADVVHRWLSEHGMSAEQALAEPFQGGTSLADANPNDYTHLLFVCGPFGNGGPIPELLERFSHCKLIGINLSMLDRLENWNPFDYLLERDSNRCSRPDIVFLADSLRSPCIGKILVHPQKEYGGRARHAHANAMVLELLAGEDAAVVDIDTRLDHNTTGLKSAAEVESLISRMDAVVTTRLHGTVLALKNGVPALVIDPVSEGAKVSQQVQCIGWPVLFNASTLNIGELRKAYSWCLGSEARAEAVTCRERAKALLSECFDELLHQLGIEEEREVHRRRHEANQA